MNTHQRIKNDASFWQYAIGDKFLVIILGLDVLVIFWIWHLDKVAMFVCTVQDYLSGLMKG